VNVKNLRLFLLVCVGTGILLSVGWAVGDAFGKLRWFLGAMIGAVAGLGWAVAIASRHNLLDGATWSTVTRFSFCGFLLGLLVASFNVSNDGLIMIAGVPGAGLGALFGKFLDRIFIKYSREHPF
jgi:hypothetical protein